jgi:hypothetical protein
MTDPQQQQIAALRAAGFGAAADLITSMQQTPQQQPQPVQPANVEAAEFARQIKDATDQTGWVSTPITAPTPDEQGRF